MQRSEIKTVVDILDCKERNLVWLAGKLSIHPSLITHWKTGKRKITPKHKTLISEALEVPEYLIFSYNPINDKAH